MSTTSLELLKEAKNISSYDELVYFLDRNGNALHNLRMRESKEAVSYYPVIMAILREKEQQYK